MIKLISLVGLAVAFAAPASKVSSKEVIDKLQENWELTRSYQGDFEQTVKSKATGLAEEPTVGTLFVVKPDRLRWEDKTNHQTQIINGENYWDIQENPRRKSRTVEHRKDISKNLAQTSFQILMGNGKFKDFYTVKLRSQNNSEVELELIPKAKSQETFIAKIDKNSYVLRSLTTVSEDSSVVLEFKNVQRNKTIEPEKFQYVKQKNDVVGQNKGS